ncbi:MAG: hypothetical protein AB7O04_05590, partial [Hyphomonadaceae bacterium]
KPCVRRVRHVPAASSPLATKQILAFYPNEKFNLISRFRVKVASCSKLNEGSTTQSVKIRSIFK